LDNIQKLNEKEKRKINPNLEKIVIAVSGPLEVPTMKDDPATGSRYSDSETRVGKMIFLADKEKYDQWEIWMKENDQWDEVDEIYIYDRYHKNGEDMIQRASMMLHEFSHTITLKDKFKECWFDGQVSGCKLWDEHALDPKNKAWNSDINN
tara:strand:+ start:759 stop:1211 length:453 start_codon:yes stop_codon:yes gene_type:complete